MDLVLRRSMLAAQKAGTPALDPTKDANMRDELLLFIYAVRRPRFLFGIEDFLADSPLLTDQPSGMARAMTLPLRRCNGS